MQSSVSRYKMKSVSLALPIGCGRNCDQFHVELYITDRRREINNTPVADICVLIPATDDQVHATNKAPTGRIRLKL